jgi:hypothetical protein
MTLTWFEKLPNADAYRVGGHFAPYAVLARPVRFSDAELAAEYQANESEAWRMVARHKDHYDVDRAEEIEDRERTLHRFATYPHFDEGN